MTCKIVAGGELRLAASFIIEQQKEYRYEYYQTEKDCTWCADIAQRITDELPWKYRRVGCINNVVLGMDSNSNPRKRRKEKGRIIDMVVAGIILLLPILLEQLIQHKIKLGMTLIIILINV